MTNRGAATRPRRPRGFPTLSPSSLPETIPRPAAAGSGTSDEALLDRLQAGDEGAFEELVARHRPWLVRLAGRLLGGDRHAAEDLAQESLVKLHRAVRQGDRPLRLRPWLTVVTRHACADECRRRRPDLPGTLPERPARADTSFPLDPTLAQAFSSLRGRHREVLYLRELLDLPYTEIAGAMGLSVSATETLLFRARRALRRRYEDAGGTRFGCGVLGLALYRQATGSRPSAAAAAHLADCARCHRALEALRGELAAGAPEAASGHASRAGSRPAPATTGDGVAAPPVLSAAGDVGAAIPTVGSPVLSAVEPFLTKLASTAAALVAAASFVPVAVAPSPATRSPSGEAPTVVVEAAGTAGGEQATAADLASGTRAEEVLPSELAPELSAPEPPGGGMDPEEEDLGLGRRSLADDALSGPQPPESGVVAPRDDLVSSEFASAGPERERALLSDRPEPPDRPDGVTEVSRPTLPDDSPDPVGPELPAPGTGPVAPPEEPGLLERLDDPTVAAPAPGESLLELLGPVSP